MIENRTKEELWMSFRKTEELFLNPVLKKLQESMSNRVHAVLQQKGGYFSLIRSVQTVFAFIARSHCASFPLAKYKIP